MKNQLINAFVILFFSCSAMAQETPEKNNNKFEFAVSSKLGFARLKQTGNPSLNGNVTGSEILLAYKISPKWDIATGVGGYEFNANTTIAGNAASIKNSYLRIPLQLNGDFSMFKSASSENTRIFFTLGLGFYANTLLKQELETFSGNADAKNLGWNFGFSTQVGAKFIISDSVNIGIGLESQSDITKAKKDGSEQKMEQFNGLYFKLGFLF